WDRLQLGCGEPSPATYDDCERDAHEQEDAASTTFLKITVSIRAFTLGRISPCSPWRIKTERAFRIAAKTRGFPLTAGREAAGESPRSPPPPQGRGCRPTTACTILALVHEAMNPA